MYGQIDKKTNLFAREFIYAIILISAVTHEKLC